MTVQRKPLPPAFHLLLVVSVGLLFWSFWPDWGTLWQTWNSDPDYNHGFLVIPICLWLLWQRRAGLSPIELAPSWWGIALIVAAGFLRVIGAEFFISQIETWSIPIWIAGVVLLFGGWGLLRWSAGPIAFLWFMTPLPESMIGFVSLPLQQVSAALSTWTLHLFAQPAVRSGTTISLGEHVLEVERACSGLRICYGIAALAVAYVVLTRSRPLRAFVLLSLALPVAIFANSVRVTATGLLFLVVSGERAHKYVHDFSGFLMMPLAVFLFWLTHQAIEKVSTTFVRSQRAGNILLLKWGGVLLIFATGLIFWQQNQADAAVRTLLDIAARHERMGMEYQEQDKASEAAVEWLKAIGSLDRYCRVRPEDAETAIRLAATSEKVAVTKAWQIRSARYYERAWGLDPGNLQLGEKQAELALSGDDFQLAIAGAEKLLQQADPTSSQHLNAFRVKVQAQVRDAGQSNPRTSWAQVVETLNHGIKNNVDVVSCSHRLAIVYREHPIESIAPEERESAAERVLTDLVANRPDDPLAWFARYAFHQVYPPGKQATKRTENSSPPVESLSQDPDADLDRAIQLAETKVSAELHPVWITAATREMERKQFQKARAFFRRAIQAQPFNIIAYVRLARMESGLDASGELTRNVKNGQHKAAITTLKEGLAHKELNGNLALQVELIRSQLMSLDEHESTEAKNTIASLKGTFQSLPAEIGVPLQLQLATVESQAYADAGDFATASRLLEVLLTSDEVQGLKPGDGLLSSSWLALGSYFEQQGLNEKASDCFRKAQFLEPNSIPTTVYQAFVAEREQNTAVAADLYEDLADRLGNRPEPWLAVSRNELRQQLAKPSAQQDFSRSLQALSKAVALGAPSADTAILYSEIAGAERNNDEAVRILDEAVGRDPLAPELWRRLAIRRQAQGNADSARDALMRYREVVDDPVKSAMLESELLIQMQDFEGARRVLSEMSRTAPDLESQRTLLGELVRVELIGNNSGAALDRLEQFAKDHPEDIQIKVQLANLYYAQRRLDLVEQTEQQLRQAEGESGTNWKEQRARRLILLAGQTKVETERKQHLEDARTLVQILASQLTPRPLTLMLQGQLLIQEGRPSEAVRLFEMAWNRGERSTELATELVFVLQSSGDVVRSEYYLSQMQSLLPVSPQLFDLALAAGSSVTSSDVDRSTQIVQNWVQSITDAESYLRLARTLLLKNVQGEQQRKQWLTETEAAYRKCLELDSKNTEAWGELMRFLYFDANSPARMITELREFYRNSEIPELERNFVTSRVLAEIGQTAQAARFWNRAIQTLSESEDKQIQNRVLLMAAQFFAGSEPERAASLARKAMELKLSDATSLRLLTALLSDLNTAKSLGEASTQLSSLKDAGERSGNQLAIDSDKRIIASVLYRRAILSPTAPSSIEDLRNAAQLIQSVKTPSEADSVQLARIVAAQGDKQKALIALAEQARRIDADVSTIRAFVEYWQDNFAKTETMRDRVDQAYQGLEKTPGNQLTALDLRLRQGSLTDEQVWQVVREFVIRTVEATTDRTQQDAFLQQVFAYLAQKKLWTISLQLMETELPPLTRTQKLDAVVLIATLAPGPGDFETSLSKLLESEIPVANNANLNRSAADYYFMRADWASAEQCYRSCLQLDPNDLAAANNLALVVAESRGDFQEADKLLQKSLTLSTETGADTSFLLDTQSQLLLAEGKTDEALKILQQLAESPTADSSVYLHLADCYDKLGKADDSRLAFSTSLELGLATAILPPMDKRTYDRLLAKHPGGSSNR